MSSSLTDPSGRFRRASTVPPVLWPLVGAGVVAGVWILGASVEAPPFSAPALAGAAALVVGCLGGWGAVLGGAAGAVAGALATGAGPGAVVGAAIGAAVVAAGGWLVMTSVGGVGRGLPSLRSHLWLVGSAAMAAVVGSLAFAPAADTPWELVALWTSAVELFSVALFVAPLALLAVDRWGRRFRLPIHREVQAEPLVALDLSGETLVGALDDHPAAEATLMLVPRRREIGWQVMVGALALVLLSGAVLPLFALAGGAGHWPLYLYLLPVLWAAGTYGLRGGVAAAAGAGLVFFVGRQLFAGVADGAFLGGLAGSAELDRAGLYLDFLVFQLLGGLVGAFRGTEVDLRRELAQRNRLLRRDLMRVVQALVSAVEAKDPYTEGHLKRVAEYAVTLGESLGLGGRDLEMLHYASLLHDIGKIGVPAEVLQKRGPLDPAEEEVMRSHAEIGAQILEGLDVLAEAAPIVRHHQERYDGRADATYPGYPDNLAGDAIPLGARIIAVVDAYDAMTTDRPYRSALDPQRAIAELESQAGRQFDPRVVGAFLALLARRPWLPERVA